MLFIRRFRLISNLIYVQQRRRRSAAEISPFDPSRQNLDDVFSVAEDCALSSRARPVIVISSRNLLQCVHDILQCKFQVAIFRGILQVFKLFLGGIWSQGPAEHPAVLSQMRAPQLGAIVLRLERLKAKGGREETPYSLTHSLIWLLLSGSRELSWRRLLFSLFIL